MGKLKRKEEEEKILQEKGTELRKEENIEQTGDELISKLRGKPKTKESELQLQHQTKEETEHTYKLSETSSKEENLHTSRQKETDVDTYERKYAVASTSQLEESVVPKVTRGSSSNQSSLEKECKDGDQMEAKSSTEQDTIIYRTPGGRSYMIERDRGYNEKNVEDLLEKVKQLKIKCGLEVAEKGDTQKDPLASTSAKTYGSDYPLMKEKGNALDATLIETQESKKDPSSQVLEQVKSRLEELERKRKEKEESKLKEEKKRKEKEESKLKRKEKEESKLKEEKKRKEEEKCKEDEEKKLKEEEQNKLKEEEKKRKEEEKSRKEAEEKRRKEDEEHKRKEEAKLKEEKKRKEEEESKLKEEKKRKEE